MLLVHVCNIAVTSWAFRFHWRHHFFPYDLKCGIRGIGATSSQISCATHAMLLPVSGDQYPIYNRHFIAFSSWGVQLLTQYSSYAMCWTIGESKVRFRAGERFCPSLPPDWLWAPPSLLCTGYCVHFPRWYSGRRVELTIRLQSVRNFQNKWSYFHCFTVHFSIQ